MKIKNVKILITGANRGIGLALAGECAKRGAKLHIQMRSEDPAIVKALFSRGAQSVQTWIVDLQSRQEIDAFIQKIVPEKVDVLINNAGQLTGGLLEDQNVGDIYSMFQVNLLALVHLTHGLLPSMIQRKSGLIVNNSSVSAFMHFPCASTYSASKAAVVAFSECLNAEITGTGVKTLCLITPGVKTRMFNDIPNKYGKHIKIPEESITPEEYAIRVCDAIESNKELLLPTGATGFALKMARLFPSLFRAGVLRGCRRS